MFQFYMGEENPVVEVLETLPGPTADELLNKAEATTEELLAALGSPRNPQGLCLFHSICPYNTAFGASI